MVTHKGPYSVDIAQGVLTQLLPWLVIGDWILFWLSSWLEDGLWGIGLPTWLPGNNNLFIIALKCDTITSICHVKSAWSQQLIYGDKN